MIPVACCTVHLRLVNQIAYLKDADIQFPTSRWVKTRRAVHVSRGLRPLYLQWALALHKLDPNLSWAGRFLKA